MKRKIKWLVAAAVAAALVGSVVFFSGGKNEPAHNGKLLSEWMSDLLSTNLVERAAAKEAVRAMGAEAIPHLTNALAANPEWDKKRTTIIKIAPNFVWRSAGARELVSPSWYRKTQALVALKELGPAASNAIPAIIASDDRVLGQAFAFSPKTDVLLAIGPASIPALIQELSSTNRAQRQMALSTLREFGPQARGALPYLVKTINERTFDFSVEEAIRRIGYTEIITNLVITGSPDQRLGSIRVIRHFGSQAIGATNVLAVAVKDTDPALRTEAMRALSSINAPDEFIAPIALELLGDPEDRVRLAAANVIVRSDDLLRANWNRMELLKEDSDLEIRRLVKRELAVNIRLKP